MFLWAPAFVSSSKGGNVATDDSADGFFFKLSGPEWTGIKWLVFHNCDCGAPAGGFTALTLTVASIPQPAAVLLFGVGAVAVLAWRRRPR